MDLFLDIKFMVLNAKTRRVFEIDKSVITKRKIKEISFADIIILNTALLNDAKILTGAPHFFKLSNSIML